MLFPPQGELECRGQEGCRDQPTTSHKARTEKKAAASAPGGNRGTKTLPLKEDPTSGSSSFHYGSMEGKRTKKANKESKQRKKNQKLKYCEWSERSYLSRA